MKRKHFPDELKRFTDPNEQEEQEQAPDAPAPVEESEAVTAGE